MWLLLFSFVGFNSPFKDLPFLRGPILAQKPLYLVLNIAKTSNGKKQENKHPRSLAVNFHCISSIAYVSKRYKSDSISTSRVTVLNFNSRRQNLAHYRLVKCSGYAKKDADLPFIFHSVICNCSKSLKLLVSLE